MKKVKFMSILAVGAMVLTTAIPTFAAGESTAGVDTTYFANSTSPDASDWLVTFPKKMFITDSNKTPDTGAEVKFKMLDKFTQVDYQGNYLVNISVPGYTTTTGILLNGVGGSVAGLAIANQSKVELVSGTSPITTIFSKGPSDTANEGQGYVYLKNKPVNANGAYSGSITFKFQSTRRP